MLLTHFQMSNLLVFIESPNEIFIKFFNAAYTFPVWPFFKFIRHQWKFNYLTTEIQAADKFPGCLFLASSLKVQRKFIESSCTHISHFQDLIFLLLHWKFKLDKGDKFPAAYSFPDVKFERLHWKFKGKIFIKIFCCLHISRNLVVSFKILYVINESSIIWQRKLKLHTH